MILCLLMVSWIIIFFIYFSMKPGFLYKEVRISLIKIIIKEVDRLLWSFVGVACRGATNIYIKLLKLTRKTLQIP